MMKQNWSRLFLILKLFQNRCLAAPPVRTHAGVSLVLDPASPGADLVRYEPAAVLVVEVELALLVLVHGVASTHSVQVVRAETLLLVSQ